MSATPPPLDPNQPTGEVPPPVPPPGPPPVQAPTHVDSYRESVVRTNGTNRGLLIGAGIGVAALLLVALFALFLRPGSGGQTNVNVGGSRSAPSGDAGALSININLTREAERPAPATFERLPTSAPRTPTTRPAPETAAPAPTRAAPSAVAPTEAAPLAPIPATPIPPTAIPATEPPAPPTVANAPSGGTTNPGPVAAVGLPAGWQLVRDPNGACQCGVPPNWQVDGTSARDPSGGITLTLQTQPMANWNAFVQAARAAASPAQVTEESATRLWFEQQRGTQGTETVVAVPADRVACVLRLAATPQASASVAETLRQIAQTLRSAAAGG
jgi:hypothetical protein